MEALCPKGSEYIREGCPPGLQEALESSGLPCCQLAPSGLGQRGSRGPHPRGQMCEGGQGACMLVQGPPSSRSRVPVFNYAFE